MRKKRASCSATSLAYLSPDLRQVPIAAFVAFSMPSAERAKAETAQLSTFRDLVSGVEAVPIEAVGSRLKG